MIPAGLAVSRAGFNAWARVYAERLASFDDEDLGEMHVALSALKNEVETVRVAVRDQLASRLAALMESGGDTDAF